MNKPYPWRCATCNERAVKPATVDYRTKIKHENALHDVYVAAIPAHKCENCGAVSLGEDADNAVRAALRDNLHLLKSSTIRTCREELSMTQQTLADVCGFAPETLSRWENGVLQSRSSDRLLRVYFGVPAAREFLHDLQDNDALGQCVVWEVEGAESDPYCIAIEFGGGYRAERPVAPGPTKHYYPPPHRADEPPSLAA